MWYIFKHLLDCTGDTAPELCYRAAVSSPPRAARMLLQASGLQPRCRWRHSATQIVAAPCTLCSPLPCTRAAALPVRILLHYPTMGLSYINLGDAGYPIRVNAYWLRRWARNQSKQIPKAVLCCLRPSHVRKTFAMHMIACSCTKRFMRLHERLNRQQNESNPLINRLLLVWVYEMENQLWAANACCGA